MSLMMLKQNADILAEVCRHYDQIAANNPTSKELAALKSQILFLLTAIKKLAGEEQLG
ncbi:hypothetical protein HZB00_02595 [Candidatus Woesearchaeota archaeon]|nr:hypothetical protein [Candidatus Woesearchaeota archaeon]